MNFTWQKWRLGKALSIPGSIQLFLELCLYLLELHLICSGQQATTPGFSQWFSLRICACIYPCTSSASISVRAAEGDQHLLFSFFSINLFLSRLVASAWEDGNGRNSCDCTSCIISCFLGGLFFAIQETTWHVHGSSSSLLVYWQMSTLYLLQA